MNRQQFRRSDIAWAVCLAISAAWSQSPVATAASAGKLEETIVTASRSKERVLDSPASLSIINEEDMRRSTTGLLADLMRDLPGVQVSDSGQPGLSRVRIRGEESRRTAILINSQEVTDHHEVGTPLTLHPAMVERVEAIRGSGGVLYGSRALSGVINFITRKGGTEPLQATLSSSYNGTTRGHDTFASLFGNVSGLEYRVAWSEGDHEDRHTPAGTIDNTSFENRNLYAYVGRAFNDHRLEYTYEDFTSSSDIFVEEEVRTTFPLTDFFLETPQRDRNKHAVFYSWDVDNQWLKNFTANAYRQSSDRHFYTRSELVFYERDINSFSELETDGALLQLNLQPLSEHRVIAGVQYVEDEVDQTRNVDTLSFSPTTPTGIEVIGDRAAIETWAWFVQDQWELHPDVELTAGLRQYFVEGDLKATDRTSLTPGNLADDDEVIGALGLVWDASDKLRLRAHIAEGYAYPSLMQLATGAYAGSSFVNPEPDLSPETSINYELGLRMQREDLTLDATVFYTESEDYIHHLPCVAEDQCPGRRDRRYLNIGESKAHGVELFFIYAGLPAGMESYANVTWMERRNDYEALSTWDTGVPKYSGRAGLRWEGNTSGVQDIWIDGYLRGETKSDLEEPGTSRNILESKSGWVTTNLAMGLTFGGEFSYQLALEVFNLADKKYLGSTENLYGSERSAALKFTMDY